MFKCNHFKRFCVKLNIKDSFKIDNQENINSLFQKRQELLLNKQENSLEYSTVLKSIIKENTKNFEINDTISYVYELFEYSKKKEKNLSEILYLMKIVIQFYPKSAKSFLDSCKNNFKTEHEIKLFNLYENVGLF